MKISRSALKHNSKFRISGTKPSPILIFFAYAVIIYVLSLLISVIDGSWRAAQETIDALLNGVYMSSAEIAALVPEPSIGSLIFQLLIAVMMLILFAGQAIYALKVCRGEKSGFKDLFEGFGFFLKIIWLHILTYIFTFLWTLLLVIPGIIARYRYSQALYILIDNPELSALECIRRSKALMNGRKGELFVLHLSFLGWILLTIIPFVSLWVTPYTQLTYANFYLALADEPAHSAEPTEE
ncbi:MAG: DUF975 family protein [Oscillospiraceae bacterium]|nr:DUF975 family protein [Oscillospiraceae bacterium]